MCAWSSLYNFQVPGLEGPLSPGIIFTYYTTLGRTPVNVVILLNLVSFLSFLRLFSFLRQGFSVSLCLSWISLLDQAAIKLRDLPAPASQVLGLKACTTTWLGYLKLFRASDPSPFNKECFNSE